MTHGSQDPRPPTPQASLGCDHFSDMNDLDSFGLIDPVLCSLPLNWDLSALKFLIFQQGALLKIRLH